MKFWRRTKDTDTVREDSRTVRKDTRTTDRGQLDGVPWWVSVFTDWGRPLAAVVVLVLCAPGEQHLAALAGFPHHLTWAMAGLFSMYAGIAAVVATVRPKGSPGKKSAVSGAVVSLLLAMGAQPVSHLFVTGWLSATPRAPWILVVIVSCVPPFILGHLLHLAASPSGRTADKAPVRRTRKTDRTPDTAADRPLPKWLADNRRTADSLDTDVSALMSAPDSPPDTASWTAPDNGGDTGGQDVSWTINKTGQSEPRVRRTADGSMADVAVAVLRDEPDADNDRLRAAILDRFGTDTKPDSISKSIRRARARVAA